MNQEATLLGAFGVFAWVGRRRREREDTRTPHLRRATAAWPTTLATMRTWMLLALWLTGSATGGGREPVNPTPSAVLGDGSLLSVAYSPDGRWLASGGGRVVLRDARTRTVARVFDNTGCAATRLGFSPDGEVLGAACGAAGEFRFWRVDTGAQVTSVRRANALAWNFAFLPGTPDFVAAFSSPQLVGGSVGSDVTRQVGAVHPRGLNAVATGPGVLVSTGEDGRVLMSPRPALTPVRELRPAGFDNPVRLAVNPQGTVLAVGDVRGTVDLYRLRDLVRVARLPGGDGRPPPVFAFSPDGRTLAAQTGGVLHLVDAGTGAVGRRVEVGFVEDLVYAPDGGTLVLAGPHGALRGLDAGSLAVRFENAAHQRLEAEFSRLAVTRSGQLLSGTVDGRLLGWDLDRTLPALVRRVGVPGSAGVTVNSPVVATARGDLALVVGQRTERGLPVHRYDGLSGTFGPVLGQVNSPEAAALSPDGRTVALGVGRDVELRGTLDGRLRARLSARGVGFLVRVGRTPTTRHPEGPFPPTYATHPVPSAPECPTLHLQATARRTRPLESPAPLDPRSGSGHAPPSPDPARGASTPHGALELACARTLGEPKLPYFALPRSMGRQGNLSFE